MTCKLKALGLAFVAVLAFGALSATAASAASFHSDTEPTILDGKQPVAEDDVYTFKAGTVKCNYITYSGTTTASTTETITVTPTFTECTAFGFVNATVSANGCTYTFNAGGWLTINCPAGATVTVQAYNCRVKFGTQSFASGFTYDNAGSGTARDVTATGNLSGIKYSQENGPFPGCAGGAGSFTDGTYKGSATFTGTNTTGGAVGIWRTS